MPGADRRLTVLFPDLVVDGDGASPGRCLVLDPAAGTIAFAGGRAEGEAWLAGRAGGPAGPERVAGGVVLPGLTDAHTHPLLFAFFGQCRPVLLFQRATKDDVLAALGDATAGRGGDGVVLALGLNTAAVPDLTGAEVGRAAGGRRVIALDPSFHGGVVSPRLAAEIDAAARAAGRPPAGYLRDGRVAEGYALLGLTILWREHTAAFPAALDGYLRALLRRGVTSVHDLLPLTTDQFVAALDLRRGWAGRHGYAFPVRRFHLDRRQLPEFFARLDRPAAEGLIGRDEARDLVGLKLFADGSFGARTARLKAPYRGGGGAGIRFDTPAEMAAAMRAAADLGVTAVAIHAIGDAGIDDAVRAGAEWRRLTAARGVSARLRIEHFELPLPRADVVAAVKALGAWVVPQPNFLLDHVYEDRLGDRVRDICPLGAAVRAGVPTMFGTDGMPESMLFALYLATHAGEPHQRVTPGEALAAATTAPAGYEGDRGGTLATGEEADLILADPALLADLGEGPADVRQYRQGVTDRPKVEELEGRIRRVYKTGVEVYRRVGGYPG